ncbi:helix-turn-helix domain-containing protein [Erwinia sp. DT-104]|uniref:helix-turn-helix domain-containing protein n=1 Tax=Erwinia sp. DT-104 TaxID=3396161 RepID=UPI003F1A796D
MSDERLLRMQRKAARLGQLGLMSDFSVKEIDKLVIHQQAGQEKKQPGHPQKTGGAFTGTGLRAMRQRVNLSQTNFARSIGMSVNAVRKIEAGRKALTSMDVKSIKKMLD